MKCYSTEEKGAARDCIETFCSNSNSSNSIDYIKLLKEQLLKIYSENVVRLILNNINIDITKKVISKSEAKILCKTEGIELKGEVTYAALNKTELTYWANPNKKVLYGDWWLLLIDSKKYKFHILNIPPNSINIKQFAPRGDTPEKLDIQIEYGNNQFKDIRSKIEFEKYFIKTIKYSELSI